MFKSDIEIARETTLQPIKSIASRLGLNASDLFCYGDYMAKVTAKPMAKKGKLVLVTAINPTASGEGKTTICIGLADALKHIGKNVCLALREPSLGPVFGIKGGATGGGYSQIAPMDDINLHFTGDMHAITSANNLLCAIIDNSVYWGNPLKLKQVYFHRCMDMNDRALRNTIAGIKYNERADHFDITAASEVMAVLCLSKNADDLKQRLGRIIIGLNESGEAVTASDLQASEAMAILLKDAIKPNLVQTLEGTPALVHGGPFANIAHGCNSIIATNLALGLADYVVTEAGFGADLGAEKFLDIKCREAGLAPDAVVIVATIKALKCAGGKKENLSQADDSALISGLGNLLKHIQNMTNVYNRNVVVALNKFQSDTAAEIDIVRLACEKCGAKFECSLAFSLGGKGGTALATAVINACDQTQKPLTYAYELTDSLAVKIEKIAKKIYGASGVIFAPEAQETLAKYSGKSTDQMPVCIAKTQYSLSDNSLLVGAPTGFDITVKQIVVRGGAGFVVAIAGEILLMPGLSKQPNALNMTINGDIIEGLF